MSRKQLFNIIKNEQKYWLVDQIKQDKATTREYIAALQKIVHDWNANKIGFISVLIDQHLEDYMTDLGFMKVSITVEYTRDLNNIEDHAPGINAYTLANGCMADQEFSLLYEQCSRASANKNKAQSKDELLQSLKQELGENWRSNCYVFTHQQTVIGLAIPHIEMGTNNEGRLFYFGVMPESRGKGLGKQMHRKSLALLKNLHASYYVGSTDESNLAMIEIFRKNGCQLRDRKGIYRLEKTNT